MLVGTLNGRPKNGHGHGSDAIPGSAGVAAGPPIIALPPDPTPSWPPAGDAWPAAPVDEYAIERQRLEAEIAAARARTAAARHRAAQREAEVQAALRAEILASQQQLAEMEREHEAAVAAVHEAARVEAAQIVAAARQQLTGRAEGVATAEPAQVPSVE